MSSTSSTTATSSQSQSQWPGTDSGYGGSSNSPSGGMKGAPKWGIRTDGERYVEALEKRIEKVKSRPSSSKAKDNQLQLPHDVSDDEDSSSDPEQPPTTGDLAEEDIPDDNETTCLLYDAAKQDRVSARRLRREAKEEAVARARARARARKGSVDSTTSASGASAGVGGRSGSPAPRIDSAYYNNESLASSSRRGSADVFNDNDDGLDDREATPGPTVNGRIQFSDLVKISGGIRRPTSRSKRRNMSPRPIVGGRRVSLPISSTINNRSGSSSPLYSRSPSTIDHDSSSLHHPTPQSVSMQMHKPTLSRPASFLSEVSRASTPTSLYAPLLLPSKTAPSPSRTFFLTPDGVRKWGDEQVSYREMVRRQIREREMKRKKRGRGMWMNGKDGGEGEEQGERSERKRRRRRRRWGMWRCFGRTSEEESEDDEDIEGEEDNASRTSDTDNEDEETALLQRRRRSKSETTVLFGNKPWRWFRLDYWLYCVRGLCGRSTEHDEENGE